MDSISYRLTLNGFSSGANIKNIALYLQKQFGHSAKDIRPILISPPRIIREFHSQNDAENEKVSFAKLGCLCTVDSVIRYPSCPFSISQKDDLIIRRELSKILRSRSSMAILLVQIMPSDSHTVSPSVLTLFDNQLADTYRQSDTIISVDDNRFIILGFASDKYGLTTLQQKTLRALKQLMGEGISTKIGYALFPEEAQSIEEVLSLAGLPRDEAGNHLEPEVFQTSTNPSIYTKPKTTHAEKMTPLQLCFTRGRGRIFHRLLNMDPQILWLGLSQIPHRDQRAFLARLPFDSPLVSALEKLINKQSKSLLTREAENHFSAVIHQMEIETSISHRDRMTEEIMAVLKHSDELPTLPSVAGQIFNIASNPNSSGTELAEIISKDPALASKLLKTVNSAFFGFPQKISSVKFAISLLGTEEILDLAFGLAAAKVFDSKSLKAEVNPQLLWHHSLCTASIVKNLYRQLPAKKDEGVFSAGLLHDVGKIFFIAHFDETYRKICQGVSDRGQPLYEFEEDVFGLNHAVVGNYLSANWNLPDKLVHAIAYHHQPVSSPDHSELAAMVGLADHLYYRVMQIHDQQIANNNAGRHGLTYGHYQCLMQLYEKFDEEKLIEMTHKTTVIMDEIESSMAHLLEGRSS